MLFNRPNAIVFAIVVLALPVFAALGPLWLLAYLFGLSWAYIGRLQVVAAVGSCVVLALAGPALEIWQQEALRLPPVTARVASMLDQRQVEPSTLREFADLEPDLKGLAQYQLLFGELLRLHGDEVAAGLAFQRAAVIDPSDRCRYSSSATRRWRMVTSHGRSNSTQRSSSSTPTTPTPSQPRLRLRSDLPFSGRDEARSRARELAGQRFATLGVGGRNSRVRYPRLGSKDVAALQTAIPPQTRLAAALSSYRPNVSSMLLSPLSAVFW